MKETYIIYKQGVKNITYMHSLTIEHGVASILWIEDKEKANVFTQKIIADCCFYLLDAMYKHNGKIRLETITEST